MQYVIFLGNETNLPSLVNYYNPAIIGWSTNCGMIYIKSL